MDIQNSKTFTLPFHGRDIHITKADIAQNANAAIIGQYGDTAVMVTVVMGKQDRPIDFFPLTVDYEERFYAAGKIIGSRFVRREGRPSQDAVLSGRLIDRTIRPLFDDRLRRDVQVVVTILSYDEENDPDFIALLTASIALSVSDIPWAGPVAGIRLSQAETGIRINPLNSELAQALSQEGGFEAFFSGTENRINMIELAGKNVSDDVAKTIFETSQNEIKNLIAFQKTIISEIGKPKATIAVKTVDEKLEAEIRSFAYAKLEAIPYIKDGNEREAAYGALKAELIAHLTEKELDPKDTDIVWEELINEIVHKNILEKEQRPDGRGMNEIRPLDARVALLPRLHGSALFTRGQTQSLAVTTLAAPGSEQIVETMEITGKRRFMLHYNFPPYSTGEIGRMGMPGRREIGHGALAEKALKSMIPSQEKFPYTIRIVSEILSSNGSSSMASVCAGTLSLMDAGVPIEHPVAGIAIGLATRQGYDRANASDEFKIMTDIQGPEDHYGDMDLKIAGTRIGITAMQMDVKVEGITAAMFAQGLIQAKEARMQILDLIEKTLPAPRPQLSKFAPIIMTLQIKPAQIGMVIGPGGKMINGIIADYGLQTIDISEDGNVFIAGDGAEKVQKAYDFIKDMTREFEVGEVVTGPIVKIFEFGAILDLGGGKDGMIHVSEIQNGFVKNAGDILKVGQTVTAKIIRIEESGKIGLSMKVLQPKGPTPQEPAK